MKRFSSYFLTENKFKTPGYIEHQYETGSRFVLSESWEHYSSGSVFILNENDIPDLTFKAGIGISKGIFKDPEGKIVQITGSRKLLESILIYSPVSEPEPDIPTEPVIIIQKEILQPISPEIPVEAIKQAVQEMIVVGPQGIPGPKGEPGKTIIIEKQIPEKQVNMSFDFGDLSEDNQGYIDFGQI